MSGLQSPRLHGPQVCLTLPAVVLFRLTGASSLICSLGWMVSNSQVQRTAKGSCCWILSHATRWGFPECGVITQGPGRVVMELTDTLWVGVPTRIGRHNTALALPRKRMPDVHTHGAQCASVRPQERM